MPYIAQGTFPVSLPVHELMIALDGHINKTVSETRTRLKLATESSVAKHHAKAIEEVVRYYMTSGFQRKNGQQKINMDLGLAFKFLNRLDTVLTDINAELWMSKERLDLWLEPVVEYLSARMRTLYNVPNLQMAVYLALNKKVLALKQSGLWPGLEILSPTTHGLWREDGGNATVPYDCILVKSVSGFGADHGLISLPRVSLSNDWGCASAQQIGDDLSHHAMKQVQIFLKEHVIKDQQRANYAHDKTAAQRALQSPV